MAPLHPDWHIEAEPYRRRIIAWNPQMAKDAFLCRFRRLMDAPAAAMRDGLEYRGAEVATA